VASESDPSHIRVNPSQIRVRSESYPSQSESDPSQIRVTVAPSSRWSARRPRTAGDAAAATDDAVRVESGSDYPSRIRGVAPACAPGSGLRLSMRALQQTACVSQTNPIDSTRMHPICIRPSQIRVGRGRKRDPIDSTMGSRFGREAGSHRQHAHASQTNPIDSTRMHPICIRRPAADCARDTPPARAS
jgi:hypothetical protein